MLAALPQRYDTIGYLPAEVYKPTEAPPLNLEAALAEADRIKSISLSGRAKPSTEATTTAAEETDVGDNLANLQESEEIEDSAQREEK